MTDNLSKIGFVSQDELDALTAHDVETFYDLCDAAATDSVVLKPLLTRLMFWYRYTGRPMFYSIANAMK